MRLSLLSRSDEAPKAEARAPIIIDCPRCSAQFMFRRSAHPQIDACGFESYRFECPDCGAALAGIIDPADESLLVSVSAA